LDVKREVWIPRMRETLRMTREAIRAKGYLMTPIHRGLDSLAEWSTRAHRS
jgi:hypothetical protein